MQALEQRPIILVVDDESFVRDFVAHVLEHQGYIVQRAADGQEAAELFQKQAERVALVVTDLDMPRKNGLELVREIKAIRPELPVLAMSGNLQKWEEELKGISRLAKPFAVKTLLKEVEKHLGTIAP
jgi:CheY-like chemotaxis protein